MRHLVICCQIRDEMLTILSAVNNLRKSCANMPEPLCVNSAGELCNYIAEDDVVDVLTCDATEAGAIQKIEQLRAYQQKMKLVILADDTVPPSAYVRPSVLPTALLWRPLTGSDSKRVMREVLNAVYGKGEEELEGTAGVFTVEVRGIVRRVRYSEILFFEARDKKLYLHTNRREIQFPGTLERLMDQLPECFMRIHKSFIVNCSNVLELRYGENCLVMDSGAILPFSRSYRNAVKDVFS